jgi:TolB protein
VFFANPDGKDHLYSLDVASGRARPLHAGPGEDYAPSVSPDGRSVVFVSTRDGQRDLYRMKPDGTGVVRLSSGLDVWGATWSPDGRRLLVTGQVTGVMEVYAVEADGSGLTRLTRGTEGER